MSLRPPPLPPAFRLCVEACRQAFDGSQPEHLEPLLGGSDGLLGLARRHRVQGLVWRALEPLADRLPAEVRDGLAADSRDIARVGLQSAMASRQLLDAHRAANIPLLFLKGLAVGALAYGAPFVKQSHDLDLLVLLADVERSADLLVAAGFAPILPGRRERVARWHGWHKESVWQRPDGLIVELHSAPISHPALLRQLDATSPSQQVTVAPGIVLPVFAEAEQFAYLAAHGASSAWFRLKWLADFTALCRACDGAAVLALERQARALGAGRCAMQALLASAVLFRPDWLPALAAASEPADRALATTALEELVAPRAPLERRLGSVRLRFSQLRLTPGLAGGLAEARRQAVEIVRMRTDA